MNLKDKSLIRNFSIIAHIDHGKSTLADRILEMTKTVQLREMKQQLLDSMDLERERGITIKLNAVQIPYTAKDGKTYTFHLIDTPGHVDFTYEVSRSLAACEGALLVVDSTQGIEAQTLANVYLAIENDLEIIPVVNKIDLPSANPEAVIKEIEDVIGIPAEHAPLISAKTGINVEDVLEAIVKYIPAPVCSDDKPLQGLIFDSYFDQYRGVVILVRIMEGQVKVGDKIRFINTDAVYSVTELGVRNPNELKKKELVAGEVGWIAAAIKDIKDINIGDTITLEKFKDVKPLMGYKKLNPMVYCGIYPIDSEKYEVLKDALEKMSLSDSSLVYSPETSVALGFGFRCGFLGLLHMDVIQERLEREFNIDLIATAPSVIYKVTKTDGSEMDISNPTEMPDPQVIEKIEEPYVKATVITPEEFVGKVMELAHKKRGIHEDLQPLDGGRMIATYRMPLSEIVFDFFDKLKSQTKGYASFDYEPIGYDKSELVKMDILLNSEPVDALSTVVHKDFAYDRGKVLCAKLKEIIPKQMFEIPIQASIGSRIISRETIKAMRKNVLAKCYGGDISRKKKLLQKQKDGKKRMKSVGSVEIPQEAFMAVLKMD